MKRSLQLFIAAIAGVGAVRFALSVSGYPNEIVRYVSMTVVILAGTIYFAVKSPKHLDRLKTAYWLVLPYMIIEVIALGYTWKTGHQTIFHANEYSMGYPIREHAIGHLVGGLTWEPLAIFVVMEIIRLIYTVFSRALGKMSPRQESLRGE